MPDNWSLQQLQHHQLLSYLEPENKRVLDARQAQSGADSGCWRYLAEDVRKVAFQLLIHRIQPI